MYYVGLDLHKRYVTACALDSAGQVVATERRLPTALEPLVRWLGALGGPATVAVEATLHWAWVHDQLAAAGYPVVVAHPYQVKLISQARCKTDPIDARKLADLLRTNLLPAIWVPDPESRARRQLLRGRALLVRFRTRLKNRIHAYLAEQNERVGVSDLYGRAGRAWLATVALPPDVREQVELLLALVDHLTERLTRLDRRIRERVALSAEARQLMTVPGIGPYGALLILAEVGPITRFPSAHALASYAGLVPSTRSSGGKTAHGTVGAAGSHWLKWILIEAVQTLKRRPGPVAAHYERLFRAKGKPKATVAAARKLCTYLYWMLVKGWSYEDWLQQHVMTKREGRPVQSLASVA
jgi:transposase